MHQHTESINSPNNLAPRFSQSQNVARKMSSREVADLTGKSHDNVLRDARILVAGGVLKTEETPYIHSQNGQSYPEFLLSERDSLVLVSGYDAHLRARIIDRWIELESRPAMALPSYVEALRLYADQLEETQRVTHERDHAIATKAEIGSRREATAMATASAAVRQAQKLKQELGLGTKQASVVAVEKITGRKFGITGYVPLRRWCKEQGVTAPKVLHPTYGTVRSWPAGAWMDVYQIDIAELFAAELKEAV